MANNLSWPNSTDEWNRFVKDTRLTPDVAVRALALAWFTRQLTGYDLQLTSAYRSPDRNAQLIRQWDSGNRAGLTTRPAEHSLHMEGRAFDVGFIGPEPQASAWQAIGGLGEALGLRWGGRFQTPDPVHFDL